MKKLLILLTILSLTLTSAYEINYYHNDNLGSTASITDSSGQTIEQINYGLFGKPINEIKDKGYNQKEHDDTALTYFEARYQDPETGRFLTSDSVDKFPNAYIYTKNNPLKYTDPTGHKEKENLFIFSIKALDELVIEENDLFALEYLTYKYDPQVFLRLPDTGGEPNIIFKGNNVDKMTKDNAKLTIMSSLYKLSDLFKMEEDNSLRAVFIEFSDGIFNPENNEYYALAQDSIYVDKNGKTFFTINDYSPEEFQDVLMNLPIQEKIKEGGFCVFHVCGSEQLIDGQELANKHQRTIILNENEGYRSYEIQGGVGSLNLFSTKIHKYEPQ